MRPSTYLVLYVATLPVSALLVALLIPALYLGAFWALYRSVRDFATERTIARRFRKIERSAR